MDIAAILQDFAFSKYESSCYLTLLAKHPSNGSQLSTLSGIARSRIYDVLRGLAKKKLVFEIEKGLYVPLPFEELKKRLRGQFDSNLKILDEARILKITRNPAETDKWGSIGIDKVSMQLSSALENQPSIEKDRLVEITKDFERKIKGIVDLVKSK